MALHPQQRDGSGLHRVLQIEERSILSRYRARTERDNNQPKITIMIKTDLSEVGAIELIEHLQETESNEVVLNPHGSNPFGFDLYFVPVTTYTSHISNIEVVVKWAEAHRHTISVTYDTEKEAIVLRLKRLFPDKEYNEEEIIQ